MNMKMCILHRGFFRFFDMRPYASLSLAYSDIRIPYVLMINFKFSLSLFNRFLLLISAAAVAASAKSNCAQLQ